jgi:hypothetical protein
LPGVECGAVYKIDTAMCDGKTSASSAAVRSDLVLVGRTSFFPNYVAPRVSARLLDIHPALFATNSVKTRPLDPEQ